LGGDLIACIMGRRVLAFVSTDHVGPDMEIELFMLGAEIER